MYTKTFNLKTKRNFKQMNNLLVNHIFINGNENNISLSACKKANRITISADTMSDVFKFWRSIGKTPLEFYQYG